MSKFLSKCQPNIKIPGHRLFLGIVVVGLISIGIPRLIRNDIALDVMLALVAKPSRLTQVFETVTDSQWHSCRLYWFAGLIANRLDLASERERYWSELIKCSDRHLILLYSTAPEDRSLARLAATYYPAQPVSWFWLGDSLTQMEPLEAARSYMQGLEKDPENVMAWRQLGNLLRAMPPNNPEQLMALAVVSNWATADRPGNIEALFVQAQIYGAFNVQEAVSLYRQGLMVKPRDGVRWRELGDLLQSTSLQEAIDAYLQSCLNGDPGFNGCYRAGLTAERLGDWHAAIKYYQMSRFPPALKRAEQLIDQKIKGLP